MTLHPIPSEFSSIEENFIFLFISVWRVFLDGSCKGHAVSAAHAGAAYQVAIANSSGVCTKP
jgi:hypothetical protein